MWAGNMIPLHLPGFAVTGPTAERDNIDRLFTTVGALLPAGHVLELDVAHDDGCPCTNGTVSLPACTCATVDLMLNVTNPRAS